MINLKDNLLIIVGPTSIGKSTIAVELAKLLNGEVISADSMQIYKHMDIGTAKVTTTEMDGIPHHMVGVVDPDEEFTVSDYKHLVKEHIRRINLEGKLPIVVGGTGLYINSLIYDLNFAEIPPNESLRSSYEEQIEEFGNEYLHNKLALIDPESSEKISVNDKKRIMRALEIYDSTGKTMTEHNKNFRKMNNDYNLSYVALNMDRAKLYDKINNRVDAMVKKGLVQEVNKILDMGYSEELISLQAIGYKEIISHIKDEISLEEAIELVKKKSRNYAKRQLTWFRRDDRIKWIDIEDYQNLSQVIEVIKEYVIETCNIN